MHGARLLIALVAALLLTTSRAQASDIPMSEIPPYRVPKIALVVANYSYESPAIGGVPTALSDARLIADRLQTLGFDVIIREQLGHADLVEVVEHLVNGPVRKARQRGVRPIVVFYFAGHGFVADNATYVTGRDVQPDYLRRRSLNETFLLDQLSRQAVAMLLLDVCRTTTSESDAPSADDPAWDEDVEYAAAKTAAPRKEAVIQEEDERRPAEGLAPLANSQYLVGYATQVSSIARNYVRLGDANGPFAKSLDIIIGAQDEAADSELLAVSDAVRKLLQDIEANNDPGVLNRAGRIYLRSNAEEDRSADKAWADAIQTVELEDKRGKMEKLLRLHRNSIWAAAAEQWLEEESVAKLEAMP